MSFATLTPIELAKHAKRLWAFEHGDVSWLKEKFVVALANRILKSTPRYEVAFAELERALEVAAHERQRSNSYSNSEGVTAQVLAEVDRLNDEGATEEASTYLRARIAEQRDAVVQAQQGMERLIEAGIAQAVLERDVNRVVELELEKLRMDAPKDSFAALSRIQRTWYERGRDKGLHFDLEVSIALAHKRHAHAQNADQSGYALNDLGEALQTLGDRETDTVRLEYAVEAYSAALREWTREHAPLQWAMTQVNLANALAMLGTRFSGTNRLEQANEAYERALQLCSREDNPMQWAKTQVNRGNVLQTLGERTGDPVRLAQAVDAYRSAMLELTRGRDPREWAAIQHNLGAAFLHLALSDGSSNKRLEQAIDAYTAALQERPRDSVPLDWAMTQNNLGNALRILGARKGDSAVLKQAVRAYEAALQEWTPNRVPIQWAMTQSNRAYVEMAFFEKTGDTAYLDAAEAQVRDARAVFEGAEASQYIQMVDDQLSQIADLRSETA